MTIYVCWKCNNPIACTLINHQKNPIFPSMCGPDAEGMMIAREWHEAPDKTVKIKSIFPFE